MTLRELLKRKSHKNIFNVIYKYYLTEHTEDEVIQLSIKFENALSELKATPIGKKSKDSIYLIEINTEDKSGNKANEIIILISVKGLFIPEINQHVIHTFPNPNDGNFTIDLGSSNEEIVVTIADINGKVIQNKVFKQQQLLNLSIDKAKGIYLVKIKSDDKHAIIRLIKE